MRYHRWYQIFKERKIMFKRLAHVCILAEDLATTEKFYCETLGMEKAFDFVKNDAPYGFYAKAGEMTFIEVFMQTQDVNRERPVVTHFCLEVEDLDAVIETLEGRGVEVTNKKRGGDTSWQAWITDPNGVRIELMQYTETSSQYTGNTVQVDW